MKKKKSIKKIIGTIVITISLIIILLILCAGGILTYAMIDDRANFRKLEDPADYNIESNEITLITKDNLNIQAYEIRTQNPKGYIIILSGIYSPSVTAFYGYAKMFKDLEYSTILVEMRAHGNSDGDKIMLGYTEENDVNAAVNYIDSKYPNLPIIVMGTSMGGTVAINSIANNKRINGAISQSAFSSWEENIMDQFEKNGVPPLISKAQLPFTRFLLGIKYGFSNINNTPSNNISKISPEKLLLMHSEDDSQVIFNNYNRLSELINKPFDNYIVPGDNHFILESDEEFISPNINDEYYNTIKLFINKF